MLDELQKLQSEDDTIIEEGLSELMAFQDYGVLCKDHVTTSLDAFNEKLFAQSERFQAGIQLIRNNMEKKLELVYAKMGGSEQKSSGIGTIIINIIESLLDAGDAVKRKKIANKIYKDLINERISHQRAAMELQELNKRQKGGWLIKMLKR